MNGTKLPVQEQPTVIERLFEAVVEGDPEKVLALLHTNVEWTPTIWSGEAMYRGHEGVHLWLSQFGENLEHLDIRVQRRMEREGRCAVLGIVFDTRGEQKFAVKVAWSYEMEGELLRRGRAHDTWEEALEAAGLAEPISSAQPEPRVGQRALGRVRQAFRMESGCPVKRRLSRHC